MGGKSREGTDSGPGDVMKRLKIGCISGAWDQSLREDGW